MPYTGESDRNPNPVSAWDAENEISTPYYYSVWLEDYDTTLEFTPGAKTGYFRFTFPKNGSRHVLLKTMQAGDWKQIDDKTVTGIERFRGMKAFVYGQFSQPFDFAAASQNRDRQGGVVSWSPDKSDPIEFKYAISFISEEQIGRAHV